MRCCILALLASTGNPSPVAVVATQVFDGIGAGIYDTLLPLLVKSLVSGTGRYGFVFGAMVTSWRIGHGFSLLLAESLVHSVSYSVAFIVLGSMGLLVSALLAFGVSIPDAVSTSDQLGVVPEDKESSRNDSEVECISIRRTDHTQTSLDSHSCGCLDL